jgi:hypothetical protein
MLMGSGNRLDMELQGKIKRRPATSGWFMFRLSNRKLSCTHVK